MSLDEMAASHAAIPGGVFACARTSVLTPPHIPDLIGVKDRRYLDATGLQQHRSIVDMMRYAALNQGGDNLASYDGFIPADLPEFKKLPDPDKICASAQPDRYSDEQLYGYCQVGRNSATISEWNPFIEVTGFLPKSSVMPFGSIIASPSALGMSKTCYLSAALPSRTRQFDAGASNSGPHTLDRFGGNEVGWATFGMSMNCSLRSAANATIYGGP